MSTKTKSYQVGSLKVGGGAPPVLICGLCVIESVDHTRWLAGQLKEIAERVGIGLIFKASFDKANRSSHTSYRGPGMEEGLEILAAVKEETGLPLLTDVHEMQQIAPVSRVVDIIQIPAFLSRQTDLLLEAGQSSCVINIKKAQFMAPEDMSNIIAKLESVGCDKIMLTDRGTSFGYRMLVSDFRCLPIMRAMGYPVCFDATHSVQLPGGAGDASGGRSEMIPYLARAAAAVGTDAFFMETHDDPSKAKSDGPNALPLDQLEPLLEQLMALDRVIRAQP
jgi:2-dehydro-3-deoxyphosphooctonate aldolase (KDO 8-P synthase)